MAEPRTHYRKPTHLRTICGREPWGLNLTSVIDDVDCLRCVANLTERIFNAQP